MYVNLKTDFQIWMCSFRLLLLMSSYSSGSWEACHAYGNHEQDKTLLQSSHNFRTWRRFAHQQYIDPDRTSKTTVGVALSLYVLERPSQSLGLNPFENLWRDLKIAAHWCFPASLTEIKSVCKEDEEEKHKSMMTWNYRHRF